MKHLIWALAVVAAFVLGYVLGAPEVWEEAGRAVIAPTADTAPTAEIAPSTIARAAGRDPSSWDAALRRLDELVRTGEMTAAAELRERLLEDLGRRARDGEVEAARVLVDAYLARNPHDPDAYLLDSDLRQMQGRAMDALAPLLNLLGFADDPDVVERARDKLHLLVSVRETQLAGTGDIAALVRLFEDLTLRDPTFDGHRLRLAHWLLRAGRAGQAEAVLAQTGTVGADPEAREALAAQIELAAMGLPLERHGGALHVNATLAGKRLRLLVDTGATITAISRAGAAGLRSTPTGERVRVRTAGGVVESEVHRIEDVEIGALQMDTLTVLVLDGPLPQGVDGLLGMDVLGHLDGVPGTALPMPAELGAGP